MDTQELIKYCIGELPASMKARPWDVTNHGRAVLQTEEQLNAYIAAYGEMHFIKCRAALQNFPFETLTNFEIVDWGCGQGIASLTLYDMLVEHGKAYGLKRITLIEPSKMALQRAERFVRRFANPKVEVITINKGIPETEFSDDFSEFISTTPTVIHLFSNILDIRTLSLRWLARKVASFAREQHIVCVGPAMRGNSRISDFGGLFQEKTVFSRFSQYPYAYTESNHPFGCETLCFTFSSNGIDEKYVEKADAATFTDDYSYAAESLRGIIDDNIIEAYNVIRTKLSDSDSIFIRPHISTDTPDIVVVRPLVGVLFLNVCTNIKNAEAEFERIKIYRWNVYNIHLKELLGKTLMEKRYNALIKQAIYFPKAAQAPQTDEKNKYVTCLLKDDLYDENLLDNVDMVKSRGVFGVSLYENFIKLIVREGWHSYKEGDENIVPTKRQRELSRSGIKNQSGFANCKIRGVAGSGKTQILAWRAVNAQVRTGGRVLILTFNITLRNYIKYRMGQVAADFSWNQFEITNYHEFFKSQAHNHQLNPQLGDWDNPLYFEKYKSHTEKYDAILFDEAQDYKYEWFVLVKNYFLMDGGEFVVFGDGRQNIYNRPQDEEHMPRVPIQGRWSQINENQRITFRIENPNIVQLANTFQEQFMDHPDLLVSQETLPFETYHFKYGNVGVNVTAEKLCQYINLIIQKFNLNKRDVTILAQACNVLRDVEESYNNNAGGIPITTFEKKREYDIIHRTNQWPKKAIDNIRKVKKNHFTMDYENVKMATIYSFKGWESPTVILLLQPEGPIEEGGYNVISDENSPSLIYTAITRAKKNLFIINMGNEKYHDFFSKNIPA